MKPQRTIFVVLIVLALLTAACRFGASGGDNKNPNAPSNVDKPAQPVDEPEDPGVSQNKPCSRGPGDFDLPDPSVGLADLSSYRQLLQIGFEGTVEGQEQNTQTTLTRETVREPQTELTWLEVDGQPAQFFGRIAALDYSQPSPDLPCSTNPAAPAPAEAPTLFQLASLPPVGGAELAGEETLDGVTAIHYTFDEQAIGYAGQAKASGEVWVAEPGGYVLRYTLRLEAPDGLLGPGVEGVQTWLYELSEVDSGAANLPEACQPPQDTTDVPLLDGATVTQQLPGYLEYQASGSVEAAVAFYQAQAETLGWRAGTPVQFESGTRLALRPTDGSLVQISLKAEGDTLTVTIQTLPPIPAE